MITGDNHVTCRQYGYRMWLKFRPTIDNFVDRFKVSGVHIFVCFFLPAH